MNTDYRDLQSDAVRPDSAPLCVDLDGTLVKTDLLWESALRLLAHNPLYLFLLPVWLLSGKAFLKEEIARRVFLEPSLLPYNREFLNYLCQEHAAGRRLILVTASNQRLAESVANYLGVFKEVIASDASMNMRGQTKADCLLARFGHQGFDYAGNSKIDLPVWRACRQALIVGNRYKEVRGKDVRCFPYERHFVRQFIRLLRPHQWTKNLILFVPILTAHQLGDVSVVKQAATAFLAFSLCASGLYVLNDLLDLDADRHHSSKKYRALAAGDLPLSFGVALVPLLVVGGAMVSWVLPPRFFWVLVGYAVITMAYSMRIKRIVLLDAFCLAGLYTLRLVAGSEATMIPLSSWLLMFSMFIFLSLALAKRFQELQALRHQDQSNARGRGYYASDLELVASLGSGSGYLAVLVLALYVNSEQVRALYQFPLRLLFICPLILYWISRIWLTAHRGKLPADPVLFALTDRVSYFVGAVAVIFIWLATGI